MIGKFISTAFSLGAFIAMVPVMALADPLESTGLVTNAAQEILSARQTIKPLAGVSYDIGTKHVSSYFLTDNGLCKLTLMVTEAQTGDEVPTLSAARVEVALDSGRSVRLDSAEGRSLAFTCQADGLAMAVEVLDKVTLRTASLGG